MAARADDGCPREVDPVVRLDFENRDPVVSTHRGVADLRAMGHPSDHDVALGLYVTELKTGLQVAYQTVRRGATACLWISEAVIHVAFPARTIYIARELERGSCGYRVALAHELRHANTDDAVLAGELPRLKHAFAATVGRVGVIGPIDANDLQSRRETVTAELDGALRRQVDRLQEIRRKEQAKLDTPAAYRREAERCPGGLVER